MLLDQTSLINYPRSTATKGHDIPARGNAPGRMRGGDEP